MVAAASTVAVVLWTPPFGFANAITFGPPRSPRRLPTSRSTFWFGAWTDRHSNRPDELDCDGTGWLGATGAGGM